MKALKLSSLFLILIFQFISYSVYSESILKMTTINVDHGDSILVELPQGKTLLIDAGKSAFVKSFLLPYLKAIGLQKIDYLIFTHKHFDHVGGMDEILKNFPVTEVWSNGDDYGGHFLSQIKQYSLTYQPLKEDTEFERDGAKFQIFNSNLPKRCFRDLIYNEDRINNCSLGMKITVGQKSILFMGDIEGFGTQRMLNKFKATPEMLKSDVIKIGHHGIRNGSKYETAYRGFLTAVHPTVATISCSKSHPHPEVVSLLNSLKIPFFDTPKFGDVIVSLDTEKPGPEGIETKTTYRLVK